MDITIVILFMTAIIGYAILQKNEDNNRYFDLKNELNKKIDNLNTIVETRQTIASTSVATHSDVHHPVYPVVQVDPVTLRDNAVMDDVLYPPLNRTDRPNIDMLVNNPAIVGHPTRGSPDTYRPLALAKDTISNETYYLMGREKYRGSSQGEFYLVPTDKQNRLKIQLLDERGNQLIKDIYGIPDQVTIKTGIFKDKVIALEELKKTDFIGPYV
jgi:hypothetical protein